jgi:hypothetical protein
MLAAAARVAARRMGSAAAAGPAAALNVDWSLIRSKMGTDAGKAEVDKAREAFGRRLAAAEGAAAPAEVDWARYARALPDVDVAALRRDYEAFAAAIPPITYDEAADKAAHEKSEASWAKFEEHCRAKVAELQALQAEQADHKLHRWSRRSRVWQRCVSGRRGCGAGAVRVVVGGRGLRGCGL